jgi:RNase adaptor protein for sRNA GlmZ degradation
MGLPGTVNETSPSSKVVLLSLRCKELESRNQVLQQRYDDLQQQLIQERKLLHEITNVMKLDMDAMKKTTSELEDVVISLLHSSEKKVIGDSCELEGVESSGNKSTSEVEAELFRILCGIWKNKYYELKNANTREQATDYCHKTTSIQEQAAQVHQEPIPAVICPSRKDAHQQSVQAMIHRRSKLVEKMQSLKNMVRGKSLPPKRMKDNNYSRTPSNDTAVTDVCSADLSSCSSDLPNRLGVFHYCADVK